MSELREKLMKIERKGILEKLNLSGTDDTTDTLANAPEDNNTIASAPLFQALIIPNSELLQKDPVSANESSECHNQQTDANNSFHSSDTD